jgi:hypothetical protein
VEGRSLHFTGLAKKPQAGAEDSWAACDFFFAATGQSASSIQRGRLSTWSNDQPAQVLRELCNSSFPRFAGIFLRTCAGLEREDNISLAATATEDGPLENLYCLRCNRELEAGHKSVAVYMFAQTVGIRPRQKSAAQRICFCPQCSVSLAMGPPPEGALNIAAWNMIRDLVGADPALNQAAWENLRGIVGLLPATGTDGGPRRASAGGYFEF